MTQIKFGTDGWRAILNKDFTFANTDKVINGISAYIYNESKFDKKIKRFFFAFYFAFSSKVLKFVR